ncbi:CPBP family intramembrane metalloprotease [Myxococcota bacterium]|nr:CPBP family intramembrane metalloprotease [Myxococcota bacterium]MBU1432026.1 CPBP family intramembrane metalloprotease [Myxococcota bacterium]MBU1899680.1 CPBP family intramembrane metalloprotease [Myxococcota bacterium]
MKLSDIRDFMDIPREEGAQFGPFEAGILLVATLGLTVMQFGGSEMVFADLFGRHFGVQEEQAFYFNSIRSHPWYPLMSLLHWVALCVLGYLLIPALFLKLTRRRLRDYYLSFKGFTQHFRIYLALYLIVIVPVIVVSFSEDYQRIYPFYVHANRSAFDLIVWELAYGLQFLALEFLFRGFMLEGLRRFMGVGAVFVMVIPYCMLHYPKTLSESLGAIIAGVALGVMAMRYRSIWGGVFLHWMVAISMDLLSLLQQNALPKSLWP